MKLGVHAKVGISWSVLVVAGIYSFYLSKKSVLNQRYEAMKLERLKAADGKSN